MVRLSIFFSSLQHWTVLYAKKEGSAHDNNRYNEQYDRAHSWRLRVISIRTMLNEPILTERKNKENVKQLTIYQGIYYQDTTLSWTTDSTFICHTTIDIIIEMVGLLCSVYVLILSCCFSVNAPIAEINHSLWFVFLSIDGLFFIKYDNWDTLTHNMSSRHWKIYFQSRRFVYLHHCIANSMKILTNASSRSFSWEIVSYRIVC
jgi:hypothetical protein